ncbi:hypothetical protein IJ579_09255 [bacterium]|nr:hypothetical protein [bacterium]
MSTQIISSGYWGDPYWDTPMPYTGNYIRISSDYGYGRPFGYTRYPRYTNPFSYSRYSYNRGLGYNYYSGLTSGGMGPWSRANARYWQYLPLMYTRYAGSTQVTVMDDYYNNYNVMEFNELGARITGTPRIDLNDNTSTRMLDFDEIEQRVEHDCNHARQNLANYYVNTGLRTLDSMQKKIHAAVSNDKATDKDIEKLIELEGEVANLAAELKAIKQAGEEGGDTITPQEAYQRSAAVHSKLTDLQNRINAKVREIESRQSTQEAVEEESEADETVADEVEGDDENLEVDENEDDDDGELPD